MPHPDQKLLQEYIVGKLDPPDADEVERHLTQCASCEETVNVAQVSQHADSFVEILTAPDESEPYVHEPSLLQMLNRIDRIIQLGAEATSDSVERHADAGRGEPPPPLRLGEYELGVALGSGGMGAVYRGFHRRLRRPVAVKLLKSDRSKDAAAVDRFEREMEAVGRLEHPHIVRALDAGEADGTLFLVMEMVDGLSLWDVTSRIERLDVPNACEAVRQAALGIAAAHRAGMTHRDVKPGNLMLARQSADDGSPRAVVKVLDLGLARFHEGVDDRGGELTGDGQVMGTVDYMAPEQAISSREAGPPADVYSLGGTLYRLLTGRVPLDVAPNAGLVQRLSALASRQAPPVQSLRPDVPADLARIIERTLDRDPQARPSAGSLVGLLERFAKGADLAGLLAIAESDAPATESALVPTATSMPGAVDTSCDLSFLPAPRAAAAGAQPPRSRTMLWSLAAAGALLPILLLGVIVFLQTPKGTIRIDIDDPDIEVRIKDGETLLSGPGEEETTIAVGEYGLVVSRGDLTFETDKFVLKKGGTVSVRVELVGGTLRAIADGKEIGRVQPPKEALAVAGTSANEIATTDAASPDREPVAASGWYGWPAEAPAPAIAPFDAEQAKTHQAAWAKYLGVPVEYENSIGMKLRLIPPGEFQMGATDSQHAEVRERSRNESDPFWRDEHPKATIPQHRVVLSRPFYLAATETTQDQFARVLGFNPSRHSPTGPPEKADLIAGQDTSTFPVEGISWGQAAEYCSRLSQLDSLPPRYFRNRFDATELQSNGYRLPTEAEWELACRAGTETRFWTGDSSESLYEADWTKADSDGRTHEVGELRSNPFGLFDVHGNVSEFTADRFRIEEYALRAHETAVDPKNDLRNALIWQMSRSLRGGGFDQPPSGAFDRQGSLDGSFNIGFRVAISYEAVKELVARDGKPVSQPLTEIPSTMASPSPFDAFRHEDLTNEQLTIAGGGDPDAAPLELVKVYGDGRFPMTGLVTAWSPDGSLYVDYGARQAILTDATTGMPIRELAGLDWAAIDACFSRDGKTLWTSVESDVALCAHDVATGRLLWRRANEKGRVITVAERPDGISIVTGNTGGTADVWNGRTGERIGGFDAQIPDSVVAAFDATGRTAALIVRGESPALELRDVDSGKLLGTIPGSFAPISAAFDSAGTDVAAVALDAAGACSEIVVMDAVDGTERKRIPISSAFAPKLRFAPDGALAVASDGVRRVDVQTGIVNYADGTGGPPFALSADGRRMLAAAPWGGAMIYDWKTVIRSEDAALSVARLGLASVSRDGDEIAIVSGLQRTEIRDVASDAVDRVVPNWVHFATIDADGNFVGASNKETLIAMSRGRNAVTRRLFSNRLGADATRATASPDGSSLAVPAARSVLIVEASTGETIATVELPYEPRHFAISADNRHLAVTSWIEREVAIWRIADATLVRTLVAPEQGNALGDLEFSPAGDQLAVASFDGPIVWTTDGDWEENEPDVREFHCDEGYIDRISFRPDGARIAAAVDLGFRIWDPRDVAADSIALVRHSTVMNKANDLKYAPDGRHIVAKVPDGRVVVVRTEGRPARPVSPESVGLAFDGKSTSVRTPATWDGASPMTFEAWLNPEATKSAGVFGAPNSCLELLPWRTSFIVRDSAGALHFAVGSPLTSGKSVHVAAVYENGEMRLYVAGRYAARQTIPTPAPSGPPLRIGCNIEGNAFFKGVMDEVRISSVARYKEDDFTPHRRFEPDADTIALYHMDEGEGEVLNDASGAGRHGEISSGSWAPSDLPAPESRVSP